MNIRRIGAWRLLSILALATSAGCDNASADKESPIGSPKFNPAAEALKPCYRPGEKATVVTTNAKGADIAYVPVYADGLARGDTPRGKADDKGVFRGSWVIPTDAPAGETKVRIALASERDSKEVSALFTVAGADGSCATELAAGTTATSAPKDTGTTVAGAATPPGETTIPEAPTTTSPDDPFVNVPTTITEIAEGGDFKTTVQLTEACVEPGGKQTIRVKTRPRAIVTYAVVYREGSNGDSAKGGRAGNDGLYEDTFIVPAGVKYGTATAQVAAQDNEKDEKSFSGARFKVGDC